MTSKYAQHFLCKTNLGKIVIISCIVFLHITSALREKEKEEREKERDEEKFV